MKSVNIEFGRFVSWAGSQTAAAGKLGISLSFTNQILHGKRGITPELAKRAEDVSGGIVSKEHLIWPPADDAA